jgi:hypothetical protein
MTANNDPAVAVYVIVEVCKDWGTSVDDTEACNGFESRRIPFPHRVIIIFDLTGEKRRAKQPSGDLGAIKIQILNLSAATRACSLSNNIE